MGNLLQGRLGVSTNQKGSPCAYLCPGGGDWRGLHNLLRAGVNPFPAKGWTKSRLKREEPKGEGLISRRQHANHFVKGKKNKKNKRKRLRPEIELKNMGGEAVLVGGGTGSGISKKKGFEWGGKEGKNFCLGKHRSNKESCLIRRIPNFSIHLGGVLGRKASNGKLRKSQAGI